MTDITIRTGEVKRKRVIVLTDPSNFTIECCLWADTAMQFEDYVTENHVIAMKGVRACLFQGGR